jgi:hypothetical protein
MSSNRFDTSINQPYVSSYIPLPFDQISALGAKMTQEHAAKQAEADAFADALDKIKIKDEVLSEGSGDDLGIAYRSIGYGDYKNQVLNKYTQANKQLSEDYYNQKLTPAEFNQRINKLKSEFAGDYQKLKFAEANSLAIEEADKKYREAKQAGANPFILNKLAEEGARLRANPWNIEYKGAPIGEVADLEDLKNKYASGFKDQILSSGAGITDPETGYITWRDKSGVTKQRIINSVSKTFDEDPILGSQTKEQTNRWLRDRGLDWNSEVALRNGTKVKAGDYYYNSLKQDFVDGVVAKAESSQQKIDRKKDWMFADDRKAAIKQKEIENYTPTTETGAANITSLNQTIKDLGLEDVMDEQGRAILTPLGKSGVTTKGGIMSNVKSKISEEQLAINNMQKLIKKSNELGLPKPEDGDYRKQLFNYANALSKTRSTTTKLNPSTIKGMDISMLGPNSNLNNMEFYLQGDESSNAAITNEEVKKFANNSTFTGVDFFSPNQSGLKMAVASKNDDGILDEAFIAIPRDKDFEQETRAVHAISRGALEASKTGKINSKFYDSQSGEFLQNAINTNQELFKQLGYRSIPKLVAASIEKNKNGDVVLMGSYVDNSKGVPELKAVIYNKTKNTFQATSLDDVQKQKTKELEIKGALKQYNTKLNETIKPSEIDFNEDDDFN